MEEEPHLQAPADNECPVFQTLPDKFDVYHVYPGG